MKKFRILIGALALAVVAAAFIGCKKEKEAVLMIDDQTEINNPQNDAEVKRILNFKKQVETRKANPGTKSAETVTLDEAMNNIVDLFNVTYTEPMAYYAESERHYFTVSVALTADGSVLVDDVVSAYGQALAHAREAYHASTLPDKAYQRLMVTCTPQRDGTVDLLFDGKYGTKTDQPLPPTPHIDGPFSNGDNWQCGGLYTGKCDNPSAPGDAVEKLNEQLFIKISEDYPVAPAGKRTVFINEIPLEFSGLEYPGLFYTENLDETCIEWMYMNDYYAGEVNHIYRTVPENNGFSLTALYSFGRYYVISATVLYEGSDLYHTHKTEVLYGRSCYVHEDEFRLEEL
ncbi:MAG: hypothetical protein IKI09_08905 [Bacteroidales bacterium]|nr:hypothetical protein [Bacteroidales bacterium]